MRAVIFDMDGVIVDTEDHYGERVDDFMRGIVPEWDMRRRGQMMGMSLRKSYAHLQENFHITCSFEEYRQLWDDLDRKVFEELCQPMQGLLPLLDMLHFRGIPMALATSSRLQNVERVMARFPIKKYFTQIVSADEVKCKSKPAPDIFLLTAEYLNVRPENCVGVEDSTNGVQSVKAAGMRCIGLQGSPHQDVSAADIVVDSLTKITYEAMFPGESL